MLVECLLGCPRADEEREKMGELEYKEGKVFLYTGYALGR